jgi:hypothetical protein
MAAFLNTLSNIFTLSFVVTSMLSMGLALTIPQIAAPLRNGRLVALKQRQRQRKARRRLLGARRRRYDRAYGHPALIHQASPPPNAALLDAAVIHRCSPRGEAHACPQAVDEAHP